MIPIKQILLICAMVALVGGCASTPKVVPNSPEAKGLEKLTQLTHLNLTSNKLTSVTGLENLTQLTHLYLEDNPDLTKAQIDELQKALPKCTIISNPTK